MPSGNMEELLKVDRDQWRKESDSIEEHFKSFGSHLPKALNDELAALRRRLA